jgi:hypothetical protein
MYVASIHTLVIIHRPEELAKFDLKTGNPLSKYGDFQKILQNL